MAIENEYGQPIGEPLPEFRPPPLPRRTPFEGTYCRLVPMTEQHASALYAAHADETDGRAWTYLPYGPFDDEASYRRWVIEAAESADPLFFTILTLPDARPVGVAGYLRITPLAGSIEVGHLQFSPALRRTRAATEAMFLMMKRAFELGYRRYEWKCDALNAPSRAAAERLGLTFEGVFRKHLVYKGRTRDTAWFAAVDDEWEALRAAFARWLAPTNFDAEGRQRVRLSELTARALEPGPTSRD